MKKILFTGGSGYIGSHIINELNKHTYKIYNYDLIVYDHYINQGVENIRGDICDQDKLTKILLEIKPDLIIHLAALTKVEESNLYPAEYYAANTFGTMSLLCAMKKALVKNIIFSSTAAVYDLNKNESLVENDELKPQNVYGKSKMFAENIILDMANSYKFNFIIFRFFNVIGLTSNKFYKKNKKNTNLLPLVIEVALKMKDKLFIYGSDYETSDGTAIRDYIDIVDIVNAHLKGIDFIENKRGNEIFNLGSEVGLSVNQIINCVEKISQVQIRKEYVGRRSGDSAVSLASSKKANQLLNWSVSESYLERSINSLLDYYQKGKF